MFYKNARRLCSGDNRRAGYGLPRRVLRITSMGGVC